MSGIVFVKEVRRFMDTIIGVQVVDADTGETKWITEGEYNDWNSNRETDREVKEGVSGNTGIHPGEA